MISNKHADEIKDSICETGERPFECDICHARFTLKHSMMRHRRKHTGEVAGDLQSDDDDESLQEGSNFIHGGDCNDGLCSFLSL